MTGADETFDWVVVGSGAGSMVSALAMRKAGRSVVVLEKADVVGGTTAKSGGVMWIPANRFMDPGEDSAGAAITYLDAIAEDHPGASHARRLAYVDAAPKMVDFIVGEGVALERGSRFWPDYYDDAPGGSKTSRTVVAKPFDRRALGDWRKRLAPGFAPFNARLEEGMAATGLFRRGWKPKLTFARLAWRTILARLTGADWVTAGAALQGRMLKAALAAGADVRTGAAVSELAVEGGRVVGVVTARDGRPWRIGARLGVLVNAGGYAQNQAMRDRYMPGTRAEWSNAPSHDTGDLHVEMERVGAVLGQMDQMVGYQTSRAPGFDAMFVKPAGQGLTGKPGAILVDQSGTRYMNEGGSYELYCQTMLERDRTVPAVPSWAIFDATYAARYQVGGQWLDKREADWLASGYLRKGDTVAALADRIGVDPAALAATVERWNGFVDAGRDADFHRGERQYDRWLGDPYHRSHPSLGRIDRAPFYAVEIVPGDVSTYGGAVTDADARVLRIDGSPIEGLYATGVAAASAFGGVYPGAGSSVGPSMTFGYIAARHAAGLGNQ